MPLDHTWSSWVMTSTIHYPTNRPNLRRAFPSLYYMSWAFVFLNVNLAIFFNFNESQINTVVAEWVLSFRLWAFVFLMLGLLMATCLLTNWWRGLIFGMMAGFAVKFFWGIALLWRLPEAGYIGLSANIGMWFALAAIQLVLVIYLFPREAAAKDVERVSH
jgi:hypothetical protein